MNVLISGGSGKIGTKLFKSLRKNLDLTVKSVDISNSSDVELLDLNDRNLTIEYIEKYHPDIIIHLAGTKDISFCEKEPEIAKQINFGITQNLIMICRINKIKLIYFSTDYVFPSSNKHWVESDPPAPETQYGETKYSCESLIKQKLDDYAIIRTSQVYGVEGDFVDLVLTTLNAKDEFYAFNNLINCPTFISDLITMVNRIIIEKHKGVFHCVGPEALSRFQFAEIIAKEFNLEPTQIIPINLDLNKDVRPSCVILNGELTYSILNVYPNDLIYNLKILPHK